MIELMFVILIGMFVVCLVHHNVSNDLRERLLIKQDIIEILLKAGTDVADELKQLKVKEKE